MESQEKIDKVKNKVSVMETPLAGSRSVNQSRPGKSASGFTRSMSRVKMRRMSYGFGGVPGVGPVRRTSQVGMEYRKPPLMFLPTYQMDPKLPFHVPTVEKISDRILDENFTGYVYNPQQAPMNAMVIASSIMRDCKAVGFNRYRIITVCTIGQKRAQSYNNAITFLWDHERDNYVDRIRETNTAFIQVTTFGIYLD